MFILLIINIFIIYLGVGLGMVNVMYLVLIMNFVGFEIDLFFGEEYIYLFMLSLLFDLDFFEMFVILCDVLIDMYMRLLGLLLSLNYCGGSVVELFSKVDGKVRKLLV